MNTADSIFQHPHLKDTMVKVPGGSIRLRDDRIKKTWTETIVPFYLSSIPVTQSLYKAILQQNPSTFVGENHPVETVSWKEAVNFCNALSLQSGLVPCYTFIEDGQKVLESANANGYRLPSESEWEYACKAGTYAIRYGDLDTIAWFKDNANNSTQQVGLKTPNAWGLYDMLGNVWEWCSDVYDETVYGSYRVFRGGGWCDEARSVMATTRRRSHPDKFKIEDLGFRIARNAE